ncbi:MAG: histidine--tRNA ligase [Gammaproteobacteria bacterium]
MSGSVPPVRGMTDVLPDRTPRWQRLEAIARDILSAYGYEEIRLPVLERTELFERSIGAVTDIVEKEMYTFEDRSGDSLTLRPEATAGLVRAGISNGLLHNQRRRLWCAGPMFRYERPQKGRHRQFHQIDVEALGFAGPDIDAELILLGNRLWRQLGLTHLRLELNSLGTPAARAVYRQKLVAWLGERKRDLDADSVRRLETNPLRILDSKEPRIRALVAEAPAITDHLDAESAAHFEALRGFLDDAGVVYAVNPRLVRGLDYYTRTVFEWVTDRLGAQGAVCSGGRYDELVAQLGGRPMPAIGWAMGLERVVELLVEGDFAGVDDRPHAYLVSQGESARRVAIGLAERLRDALPELRLRTHCGDGSLKAQMKKADLSGASVAIVLGDDEMAAERAAVKPLRSDAGQEWVDWADLPARLRDLL